MTTRHARISDSRDLQILYAQLNPDDPPVEPGLFSQQLESILSRDDISILVAEENDRVIGTCTVSIIPNLTRGMRPYALIENVVTLQEARRTGAGRAVMAQAVTLAEEKDCYKIMLLTGRKDEYVHAFYQSLGFSGDSKQAYQMRL